MRTEGAHTGPPDRVELVIAVALREEAACIRGALKVLPPDDLERVAWLRTGMGSRHQGEVRKFIEGFPNLRLICSSGFCGGLSKEVGAGALVLANGVCVDEPGVREGSRNVVVDESYCGLLEPLILEQQLPVLCGIFLSVSEPLFEPGHKKEAARQFGAHAVDMESGMLGRMAGELGKTFMVLRSVSDGFEDELPREVGEFLDEHGRVRMGRVLAFAARNPRNIGSLRRMKARADLASKNLEKGWRAVLERLLNP